MIGGLSFSSRTYNEIRVMSVVATVSEKVIFNSLFTILTDWGDPDTKRFILINFTEPLLTFICFRAQQIVDEQ